MLYRNSIGALVAAAALCASVAGASAFDESKYPNLSGQWRRDGLGNPVRFNPYKEPGLGQEAPLTPEYQKVLEDNTKDQESGGQGSDPAYRCIAPGMPRITNAYTLMEIIVLPEITYTFVEHIHDDRRIYTDGRDWPDPIEPSYSGYSIGKWIDTNGDGKYDELDVETRGFKGPRVLDNNAVPLHKDNQTIVKERFYLDKANPDLLHDEVTVYDHAFTKPWVVTKGYNRRPAKFPVWNEEICAEGNNHVDIEEESYFLSAEGYLMPTRKGQPPPDLRYFKKVAK